MGDANMQKMFAMMMGDPRCWYKNLNSMQGMEGKDADCHLGNIPQALGDNFASTGFAIDLSSGNGLTPGMYQMALPSSTVVPTELLVVDDQTSHIPVGLALMKDCLARPAADHKHKVESKRQQMYKALLYRTRAVDVLDARWTDVAGYDNKCALVTPTDIIQMKALETPSYGVTSYLVPRGCCNQKAR